MSSLRRTASYQTKPVRARLVQGLREGSGHISISAAAGAEAAAPRRGRGTAAAGREA